MNHIVAGDYIQVDTNINPQYISQNSGTMAGLIRYTNGMYEVNDGQSWRSMGNNYTTISLSAGATAAIAWASKKMEEERKLERIIKEYPEVRQLSERLEILLALIKDGES